MSADSPTHPSGEWALACLWLFSARKGVDAPQLDPHTAEKVGQALAVTREPTRRIDQLDIDSMDLLNFVVALHKELQIEIPEADYPRLATLDGCVDYLSIQKKIP